VIDFLDGLKVRPGIREQLLDEPEEALKAAEIACQTLSALHNEGKVQNIPVSQKISIRNIRAKEH